jgi:hypothetical protein
MESSKVNRVYLQVLHKVKTLSIRVGVASVRADI